MNYFYSKVSYAVKVRRYYKTGLLTKPYLKFKLGAMLKVHLKKYVVALRSRVYANRKVFHYVSLLNRRIDRVLYLSRLVTTLQLGRAFIQYGCVRVNNQVIDTWHKIIKKYDLITLSHVVCGVIRVLADLNQQLFVKKRKLLYLYRKQKNFLFQYSCFTKAVPAYLLVDYTHGVIFYILPFSYYLSKNFFRVITRYLI